ncbi:MAG: polysaccharide deacetylase family protein [Desulfomonile tiedjei]|nr:polysaccharide deacetylase family protein [Desulfomonile tiedjei]
MQEHPLSGESKTRTLNQTRSASTVGRRAFLRFGAAWIAAFPVISPLVSQAGLLPTAIDKESGLSDVEVFPRPDDEAIGEAVEEGPLFLTFDDGPVDSTDIILDRLAENGQKATFFVIGRNLDKTRWRNLAVRSLKEGHSLGNHSYTHTSFFSLSRQQVEEEMRETHKRLEEVAEEAGLKGRSQILFFRFPFGHTGSKTNYTAASKVLTQLGYNEAWWDLDTEDWRMRVAPIYRGSRVLGKVKRVKPRDVVLFHDRARTAEILPSVLQILKNKKLTSLSMSSYDSRWMRRWDKKQATEEETMGLL